MKTETVNWRGINVEIEKVPNGHVATAVIPTRHGAWTYRSTFAIPPALWAYLRETQPEIVSAGFFDDMGKAFKAMTKSSAFADVTNTVAQVATNPMFTALLGAATGGTGVAVAQAVGGVAGAASRLASRAKAGDPKAQRAVGGIARRARAGNPGAQRAASLLREASRQEATSGPRLDSGPGLAGVLGELAATMGGQADPLAYAAMVAKFAGPAAQPRPATTYDTRRGPDGAYEVSGVAPAPKCGPVNPYCGGACNYAAPHVHGVAGLPGSAHWGPIVNVVPPVVPGAAAPFFA